MRILLVEDHPESRRTLQALIERRGHEVVAVSDGTEAWGVLQGDDPRVQTDQRTG